MIDVRRAARATRLDCMHDAARKLVCEIVRRLLVRRRPRQGQGWGYTANDFGGARWTIAKELSEDRLLKGGGATQVRGVRLEERGADGEERS